MRGICYIVILRNKVGSRKNISIMHKLFLTHVYNDFFLNTLSYKNEKENVRFKNKMHHPFEHKQNKINPGNKLLSQLSRT